MRAPTLLLVACLSNFLVWASPTPATELGVQAGSQQDPWEESHHLLETSWVGHGHPPHGLAKRWITLPDRRVLTITISQAVATALGIANTYRFAFQYHYDSQLNEVVYDYDHNQFGMRWPSALVVGASGAGRDLAVPAIVHAAASAVDSLVCTLIWGAKLRTDSNMLVGIGLFELNLATAAGAILRFDPWMYTYQFMRAPPP